MVAAALPRMAPSDLASAREAERLVVGNLPTYEARTALSIQDITVAGQQNAADVSARIYSQAERAVPVPALLYLHGCICDGRPACAPRLPEDISLRFGTATQRTSTVVCLNGRPTGAGSWRGSRHSGPHTPRRNVPSS